MLSGYVFLSVLDIYAFGGFRDPFTAEIIDEIIGGTGIFRWNLLDGSGWGVDAEDGGVDALRLYQHIHLLCRTDEVNLRLLAEVGARCAGDGQVDVGLCFRACCGGKGEGGYYQGPFG